MAGLYRLENGRPVNGATGHYHMHSLFHAKIHCFMNIITSFMRGLYHLILVLLS